MWEVFGFASVGLVLLFVWFVPVLRVRSFQTRSHQRISLLFVPFLCFGLLAIVLRGYASPDVREDPTFLYMYFLAGLVPFLAALFVAGILGISFLDDVLQKGGRASALSVAGAALASMLCYSGSNVGSGPGPEVVILCSALSLGTLFFLWAVLESASAASLSEKITVERDTAAGLRLLSWLLSLGLILGWSVAGDWHSIRGTIFDFMRSAWPAVVLLFVEILCDNTLSHRGFSGRRAMPISVGISAFYLLASSVWVIAKR